MLMMLMTPPISEMAKREEEKKTVMRKSVT